MFKYDEKLFRRYTKNALKRKLTVCLFTDDCALISSTKKGAERAVAEYQNTGRAFAFTVSIPKTMHMVARKEAAGYDKTPLALNGGKICAVKDFTYLGSTITPGRMDVEVEWKVPLVSRAFGALRRVVLLDKNLKLVTKRKIYLACILSVLMYGSMCWIPLKKHVRKLNSFHYRCIRNILGITNMEQWSQHHI